jgi:hypothetical protein
VERQCGSKICRDGTLKGWRGVYEPFVSPVCDMAVFGWFRNEKAPTLANRVEALQWLRP